MFLMENVIFDKKKWYERTNIKLKWELILCQIHLLHSFVSYKYLFNEFCIFFFLKKLGIIIDKYVNYYNGKMFYILLKVIIFNI